MNQSRPTPEASTASTSARYSFVISPIPLRHVGCYYTV
jgi:hypothetical protein